MRREIPHEPLLSVLIAGNLHFVFSSTSVAYGQGVIKVEVVEAREAAIRGRKCRRNYDLSRWSCGDGKNSSRTTARSRKQMRKQVEGKLSAELLKSADRRKVSLKQLNEACRNIVAQWRCVCFDGVEFHRRPDSHYYIYVDFKNNDIIIAGPAEAFAFPEGATAVVDCWGWNPSACTQS